MTPATWRSAIVVGASSGVGAAIAHKLALQGVRVALLARREEHLRRVAASVTSQTDGERVVVRVHDVRETGAVSALWDSIERELGPVDLLVYASGVLGTVGPAEYTFEKDREILETNLLGAVAWFDEAALRMEAARRGTILGISSVAGERGRRRAPAYCTSKAGMNAFLESLRNRLTRHGVSVVTIRLGYVSTPMTEGLSLPPWATISAERAASLILGAARKRSKEAYVPWLWRPVCLVVRWIPSFVFRRLDI